MHINYESAAGIARITIDRPAVRNAIALDTAAELREAICKVNLDNDVRVAVLTGSGDRAFASGADVNELAEWLSKPESAAQYDRQLEATYAALENCRVPVIARIQGHAFGGGCLLALACDVRIASARVSFGVPIARIGVALTAREVWRIVSAIGAARAKLLLVTGTRISAETALSWGLVDQVVADPELDTVVERVSQEIAGGAPLTIALSKRLVNALAEGGPRGAEQMSGEIYKVYGSADLREGVASFFEKRRPLFRGI
jgi:enoyl-CoA hydratase